jgi:bacillithiol system protein YtxJ
MNFWKPLKSISDWESAQMESFERPVLILKHSTRCSVSLMALDRINRDWKAEDSALVTPLYLDLLSYREVSNAIAEQTGVEHQSPQIILLERGKCTFSETHGAIRLDDVRKVLKAKN